MYHCPECDHPLQNRDGKPLPFKLHVRGRLPIIGIAGLAESGKNTAATAMAEWFGAERCKVAGFADPVREGLLRIDPMVIDHNGPRRLSKIIAKIGWEQAKRELPEIRRLMQAYGTEAGRNVHGDDCWVRKASDLVHQCEELGDDERPRAYVFADVRFPNEADWINAVGLGCVFVSRPGLETSLATYSHDSESHGDKLRPLCRVTIENDDTVETLKNRAVMAARILLMRLFSGLGIQGRFGEALSEPRHIDGRLFATDGRIAAVLDCLRGDFEAMSATAWPTHDKFPVRDCRTFLELHDGLDWRNITEHKGIAFNDEYDVHEVAMSDEVKVDKKFYDVLLRIPDCQFAITQTLSVPSVAFKFPGGNGVLMALADTNRRATTRQPASA